MATNKSSANSYRSILKGTSVFGGVQLFQILINLVRGKFVALLLGPEGMGLASIYTASANTIMRFASLGLNLSFVKEVAGASGSESRLALVSGVASRLIRTTALLGALVCALGAPWLSEISFGTRDYTWQFVLLAIAVGLMIAGAGKMALLQGLHRVRIISITSLTGALTGLIAGIPLYYFFGDKGIVPAIIVLNLAVYLSYTFGLRRLLPSARGAVPSRVFRLLTRRMVANGIVLLAATLINTGCTYVLNIYVRIYGDIADVGLFNAANSITLQYTGVVFSAMALDYFPRLMAAIGRREEIRPIVGRQMEIVALIAAPLSLLIIVTSPLIIRILLTERFAGVTELMRWLGVSIMLKAVAYPLGYIAFAHNNRRLFFWLEAIVCNVLYIGCSLAGYYLFGLNGLGYGAVVEQALCIVLYLGVNFHYYRLVPGRRATVTTLAGIATVAIGFAATFIPGSEWTVYCISGGITTLAIIFSFTQLRALMRKA
ncbi:MAG: oligosaccharide flippase family protein [Muribaculaceae bacterium]|nr:oligosaccharide flippase family protein [Muribaculaceae bacterium]